MFAFFRVRIRVWDFQSRSLADSTLNNFFDALIYFFYTFLIDKTEEVRRLGMGRLLDNLSRKMQAKLDRGADDPLKILVHSTHDTCLAALCSTLDVFDEKW